MRTMLLLLLLSSPSFAASLNWDTSEPEKTATPQPVAKAVVPPTAPQTCTGPNCPQAQPQRSGWYLGKWLGR